MINAGGSDNLEKKKMLESTNRWSCTNLFYKKFLTRANSLLSPAANTLGTSRIFIGCMKWQLAVILEPIWETDSIIILLPH